VEDMDWGDDHWAMGNHGNNLIGVNQPKNQVNGNNVLPNAIEVDEDMHQAVYNIPVQSSVTLSVSLSNGLQSTKVHADNANHSEEEVNQLPNSLEMVEHPLVNIPINVQGANPALNWDNFPVLGEGVQNIMLAYHCQGEESDNGMEEANDSSPSQNNEVNQNIDAHMEYFHFNDLVQPEVAHLQLMRA
jgi:hypothetical protein